MVTGNQWFEPETTNAGSLLRSLWNAGAIVPTAVYNNPWAGTFAMRMRDVRRARLPKIWRKSIVDDGPIREALRPLGLKIYFNPSLIMVNRERCTYHYVGRYIARMLTWSKMYESTFLNTLLHCLGTVGLLLTALAMLVVATVTGTWQAIAVLVGGLIVFGWLNALAYVVVRSAVSTSSNLEGRPLGRLGVGRLFKLASLSPVAYLIYGYACLQASTRQHIQWRQITYQLRGKSRVKMLRYRPWVAEEREQVPSEVSI